MKVAIIGGSGKMGRWFARFLLQEGNEVVIAGRNHHKLLEASQQLGVEVADSISTAVKGADAVLLSVPIDSFEEIVKQLQPHIQPGQIVADITSVKTMPVAVMHRYLDTGTVLGTHPVFGPGAKDVTDRNFVLTPTTEPETALAGKIKRYLETRGAKVTLMTPREHDEMMAVILGLSHFIAIVSADALLGFGKLKQMKAISGSTFRFLLTLTESVISEDPELYASLQMNLPGLPEIEDLFQRSVKTWADIVRNKNRQEFVDRMGAIKDGMEKSDPDFGKAYENMYRLFEK
ncbi:MAG: prephenate dehydrogenase [Dehalococcoidales bacterium]|nr:prephenate dehydrogenase [Dehalococcoidales bacterium]